MHYKIRAYTHKPDASNATPTSTDHQLFTDHGKRQSKTPCLTSVTNNDSPLQNNMLDETNQEGYSQMRFRQVPGFFHLISGFEHAVAC